MYHLSGKSLMIVAITLSCFMMASLVIAETVEEDLSMEESLEELLLGHHGKKHAHWTYARSGADWTSKPVCLQGKRQSPIDLGHCPVTMAVKQGTSSERLYKPFTSFLPVSGEWLNNGHAVTVKGTYGRTTRNSKAFESVQFHFHTPSEHTIDGKQYPMEMHVVHQAADKKLLVLGFLFEEGPENAFLKGLGAPPTRPGPQTYPVSGPIDLNALRGSFEGSYYSYSGSLTTPPCSESVTWFVFDNPQKASEAQLNLYRSIFAGANFPKGNARSVQPINNRSLVYVTAGKQCRRA